MSDMRIEDALAEIERLLVRINDQNSDYKKLEDANTKCLRTVGELRADNERLRAENARLKEIEIKYDQLISGLMAWAQVI